MARLDLPIMETSRASASSRTIMKSLGSIDQPRINHDRCGRPAGDRAIVEAVLAGERDAYRRPVERESAFIVQACHRVLGDLHEAEDAAQEAFVTAYRSLATGVARGRSVPG